MTDTVGKLIGDRVYWARTEKLWSKAYLEKQSGVDVRQITRLEKGEIANPRLATVFPLFTALDIPEAEYRALIAKGRHSEAPSQRDGKPSDVISRPQRPPSTVQTLSFSRTPYHPPPAYQLGPEEMLLRLADLIEIADALQVQRDDDRAAMEGRTINYVFDVNVFEMFIDPPSAAGAMEMLHTSDWNFSERDVPRYWHDINVQAALLASEYLFSGRLPGQQRGQIYLTDWHRYELLNRANRLAWMRGNQTRSTELARDFLVRIARVRAALDAGVDEDDVPDDIDHALAVDLRLIQGLGARDYTLNKYAWTRIALSRLAEADALAPLLQIQRLFGDAFTQTVRPASELCSAEVSGGPEENEAFWLQHFQHEYAEKGAKDRRPHEALVNDARSLALVHMINRQQSATQQTTLFVTADAIAYNAYRRWHSYTRPEEPFLLRRVMQFAPAFEFGGHEAQFFNRMSDIDHFVEIALHAFNLDVRRPSSAGGRRTMAREFAQLLEDKAKDPAALAAMHEFFSRSRPAEFQSRMLDLQKVGLAWQQLETLTLGVSSAMLDARLDALIPRSLQMRPVLEELSEREIDRWLSDLLAAARRTSLRLALPLAKAVLEDSEDWHNRNQWSEEERDRTAAFYFLSVATGASKSLLLSIPTKWSAGDSPAGPPALPAASIEDERELLDQPFFAFVVAACLVARRSRWSDALRFAQLGIDALDVAAGDSDDHNMREAERLRAFIDKERVILTQSKE